MYNDKNVLSPEDYIEPRCLLCDKPYGAAPEMKSIPQQRVIEKMDEYMSHRDYAGAERHLLYWLEEAKLWNDVRGQLLVLGELIGHYRKTSQKSAAFKCIEEVMLLIKESDYENTLSAGTTFVNAATCLNAFDENEKALYYFEKARTIYESSENTKPELLGGLYNNMALVLVCNKEFDKAHELFDLAMKKMACVPGGALEQAITCLNRANAIEAQFGLQDGEKKIFSLLDEAYDLLFNPSVPQNGYCAFVYEKCAPTFSYYGYFMAAQDLTRRSEELYERS